MDYRKTNAPTNTVTRDLIKLAEPTGNIYETVAIISKRANQISVEMKQDLEKKLPKPTLIAAQEVIEGKVYYKNPAKEKNNF